MRRRDEAQAHDPALWFRVLLPGGALGPGKVQLMRAIDELGSVSAAARRLRMSHARSVKLVAEVNALGPTPLIGTRAGGDAGGGANLTPLGREALDRYEALDRAVREMAEEPLSDLARALSGPEKAGEGDE